MNPDRKQLVIMGAGESGTGAALLADAKGYQVFVSDAGAIASQYKKELIAHGIAFEEGQHSLEKLLAAKEVVKSPGIAWNLPIIQAIKQANIPVIDEIELASRYTKAFLIGITGSNGKTTTTHLVYHLLRAAGFDAGIAGNMGTSFARKVLTTNHAYYVLELSCFQLQGMYEFQADIACLLNITPDHLDRYANQMHAYIQAKWRLLQNMQKNHAFIYNQDDRYIQEYRQKNPIIPTQYPISLVHKTPQGGYWHQDNFYFSLANQAFQIPSNSMQLLGKHNQSNTLMAIAVAALLDIPVPTIKRALQTFQGMAHRLEWVAQINGVACYNDSKATTVESSYAALSTFQQPIIWIAGGYDKGNDYSLLQPLAQAQVKALIGLGKNNKPLRQAFQGIIPLIKETQKMQEAVSMALNIAKPGDIILLAPACASFDLFKNFEDRGNQFKQAIYHAQSAHKIPNHETMDKK